MLCVCIGQARTHPWRSCHLPYLPTVVQLKKYATTTLNFFTKYFVQFHSFHTKRNLFISDKSVPNNCGHRSWLNI